MEGGGVLISEENILRALVRSRNANRREESRIQGTYMAV